MKKDLEEIALHMADSDRDWWPFLFLRPKKNQRMASTRVAALALLYGVMFGFAANLFLAAIGEPLPYGAVFALPLQIACCLFVSFRLTVAVAWNRRVAYARRIRH